MTRPIRTSGYTLIEVMMAIAIMTIAGLGLMSLQTAVLGGNNRGRQITAATEINRAWIGRLRRDALLWNQAGAAGIASTTFLSAVTASAGAWARPAAFFGHDYSGNPSAANIEYCTHIRLQWVMNQQAVRADVRTSWHRTGASADRVTFAACAAGGEPAITAELDSATPALHAVYTSNLIRWTQRQ